MAEDFTPEEARRRMIRRMRLDADEGEEEEEEKPRESESGGNGGQAHYGNTRLPYGLCQRFGIDLPADAKPRDAWAALEKGTGYTHDQVMDIVRKAGDTKGVQAKKGSETGETANGTTSGARPKGAGLKDPKSMRGMGAKEHKHFETVDAAENYLNEELGIPVNYAYSRGMNTEKANKFNDAILTVVDELGIKPNSIQTSLRKKTAYMDVEWRGHGTMMGPVTLNVCNTNFNEVESDPEKWQSYKQDKITRLMEKKKIDEDKGYAECVKQDEKDLKKEQEGAKYRAWSSAKFGQEMESCAFHEMGHVLELAYIKSGNNSALITADAYVRATKKNKDGSKDIYRISEYASKGQHEFFAECFSAYMNGMELPDYCEKMVEDMISSFGKGKGV